MNTYKTAVLRWGLRLAVILGLCTVLAGVIQSQLMPQVQAVKPYSGRLSFTEHYLATAAAEQPEQQSVQAAGSWIIQQAMAEEGQAVRKGDALLLLDVQDQMIRLQTLKAQIQEQTNYINAYNWTGGDRLVLEQKLEATKMEYRQLNASFPANGVVTAPADGVVAELAGPGAVSVGQTVACITPDQNTAANCIQWSLTAAQAQTLLEQEKLALDVTCRAEQEDGTLETVEVSTALEPYEWEEETGVYRFEASLPVEQGIVRPGAQVEVTAKSSSREYECLVPLSSLILTGPEQYAVAKVEQTDGIWGEEYRVHLVMVELLESDAVNAAVEPVGETIGSNDFIASYFDRALADGEQVQPLWS